MIACRLMLLVALGGSCATAMLGPALAATHLVRPDGSGDFPTIQAALDAAVAGDVVELADGVFRGDGNRDLYWNKAVSLRSQGGDPAFCVIDCEGAPGDEHRGVALWSGIPASEVMQGITIRGGYHHGRGGGAQFWSTGPTVISCVFVENACERDGGGVLCDGSITFRDCDFLSNVGESCGAISIEDGAPRFEQCRFIANTATVFGPGVAGIGWTYVGTVEFEDCVFSMNGSPMTGVMEVVDGRVSLINCTLTGNSGTARASAIASAGFAVALQNVLVAFNIGPVAVVCHETTELTVTCCDIFGNGGGDWEDCIEGALGQDGNICLDPQFCSETPDEDENWALQSDSPCAPAQSGCGLIGAWGVGCGTTEAEERTWGGVKLLFRE